MAIFHLTAQVIKRSEGRSVVAAAAYRAAERLVDERLGVVHNFTRKGGVEHREILVPDNAPAWALDRERLWNEVERSEKRIDAQLARELRLALPKELDAQQQVELVRGYLRDHFVSAGMIADLAIHRDNADNPHAHILLTMREVGPEGFGKKARDWNRVEALESWREQWALCCNQSLARCGLRSRVTHLSHAARGLF
ncbi:MAG TPA: MobQ family relaxase, partial [Myxococcota bacterium]|nr:MobQ family relaxase [Myxococcota bacterium]